MLGRRQPIVHGSSRPGNKQQWPAPHFAGNTATVLAAGLLVAALASSLTPLTPLTPLLAGVCVWLPACRIAQVVEIAPAPALAQSIKDALYADAVKLAKHVGYRNAGQQAQQQQQQQYGKLVQLRLTKLLRRSQT
jgi:hypothetical protein